MNRLMHEHRFGVQNARAENMTRCVILIAAITMVAEIAVGWISGSMALLADGWHMGTHVLALGITVFAYRFARRHQDDPAFTFGTGKVGPLAGFTSAILLGIVALGIFSESISRLIHPTEIQFGHAFLVACIGLVVNLLSAVMLRSGDTSAEHDHHHHDQNLRAAFLHVVADALTSVLAIVALLIVHFWQIRWVDPAIGLLGGGLITVWAVGLLRDTSRTLLDAGVGAGTIHKIRECVEADADNRVADLHVWRIGGDSLSVAVSIVTHDPRPPSHYKELLCSVSAIRHTTIEVSLCEDAPCLPLTGDQIGPPGIGTPGEEPPPGQA